jgi:hypothetical protein
MKASEFRKLIREEVRKVLKESIGKYTVGQTITDINGDEPFNIVKVYPNKAAALADVKKTASPRAYKMTIEDIASMYDSYRPIKSSDDAKPWYLITPEEGESEFPYVLPEIYISEWEE